MQMHLDVQVEGVFATCVEFIPSFYQHSQACPF